MSKDMRVTSGVVATLQAEVAGMPLAIQRAIEEVLCSRGILQAQGKDKDPQRDSPQPDSGAAAVQHEDDTASETNASSSNASTIPDKLRPLVGKKLPGFGQLASYKVLWRLLTVGSHGWPALNTLFNVYTPGSRKRW